MPKYQVLVNATVDLASGWCQLTHPFNAKINELYRELPGSRWDGLNKRRLVPVDSWFGALRDKVAIRSEHVIRRKFEFTPTDHREMKPFQKDAMKFLGERGSALLSLEMRMGKSFPALKAAEVLMRSGQATAVLVLYPAQARHGWERETMKRTPFRMECLVSEGERAAQHRERFGTKRDRKAPAPREEEKRPVIYGCHYEILESQFENIQQLLKGKRFIVIYDEVHLLKNRKSKRNGFCKRISKRAMARWGLTGTPMRNRNRDLFGVFDVLNPDCMGGYWTYAKRYCDAHQNESGFWTDKGTEAEEVAGELAKRLDAISMRLTRADVAMHLPKTEHLVMECAVSTKDMQKYQRLERALAATIKTAADDPDRVSLKNRAALDDLTSIVTRAKGPKLVERVLHYVENEKKVIVFTHLHESTDFAVALIEEALRKEELDVPVRWIDGRITGNNRSSEISEWYNHKGPAVLVASALAAQMGIDLSPAQAAIFFEFLWVPSDMLQAAARVEDMHLGKRESGAIIEYPYVRNTIDQTQALALLSKIRDIQAVVGKDVESSKMAETLRNMGGHNVGLADTEDTTVRAALRAMRDRWLKSEDADSSVQENLAASMASTEWDDTDGTSDEDEGFGDTDNDD